MKIQSVPRSSAPAPTLKKLPTAPGARPFKRRSLSRGIYICLLVALLALGLKALASHYLYWRALGVVDLGGLPVATESPGRLARILVQPGDRVEQGDLLAEFTNADAQAELLLTQATLTRIDSEIEGERARALAGARVRASFDSTEAARLRQKALALRADRIREREQIAGLTRQITEVEIDLRAFEDLVREDFVALSERLDLRLKIHELNGQLEGLRRSQTVLEQNEQQLEHQARNLDQRVLDAEADGLQASQLASLLAQRTEAQKSLEVHRARSRFDLVAPASGTVAWVDPEPGQVVEVGAQVVQLVPDRPPTVVAYPEENLECFPLGCSVTLDAPGFRALGVVVRGLAADHPKPRTMLKPYEREVVGPALLVEVSATLHGQARDGLVVTLERPRFWDP